jgi:hypothetical protein
MRVRQARPGPRSDRLRACPNPHRNGQVILRTCIVCGRIIPATRRRCPEHRRDDNRRRHCEEHRRRYAPRQLAQAAAAGARARPTHLPELRATRHQRPHRPELGGNHRLARLDDCTSLCASCHGSVDAARRPDGRVTLWRSGKLGRTGLASGAEYMACQFARICRDPAWLLAYSQLTEGE